MHRTTPQNSQFFEYRKISTKWIIFILKKYYFWNPKFWPPPPTHTHTQKGGGGQAYVYYMKIGQACVNMKIYLPHPRERTDLIGL